MKKHLYTLSLILLLAGITQKSFAQIPNPSFETWTNSRQLDGWGTSAEDIAPIQGSVFESNNAHNGSHAAEIISVPIQGFSYGSGAFLQTGDTSGNDLNFPISSAPDALHGWYISNTDSGDEIEVAIGTQQGTTTGGGGAGVLTENTSVYKEFIVNLTYGGQAQIADSAFISFILLNPTTFFPHPNNYFIIDDLSFGASSSTGVKDVKNNNIILEQNSPNPAIDQTNIIYSLQSSAKVTLSIVDVLGRTVKTVINQNQTPGRYKAIVDVNDLPAGNYFYQITAGGNFASNLMTVIK